MLSPHLKENTFHHTKINWLTVFKKNNTCLSKNHMKHINILRIKNLHAFNVEVGGTYRYQCALNV
jgi:hypothetical protein